MLLLSFDRKVPFKCVLFKLHFNSDIKVPLRFDFKVLLFYFLNVNIYKEDRHVALRGGLDPPQKHEKHESVSLDTGRAYMFFSPGVLGSVVFALLINSRYLSTTQYSNIKP